MQFTASFGVTDSSAAGSLQELIQLADTGLYVSKASGRDRVTIGDLTDAPPSANGSGKRAPALHRAADDD